MTKPVKRIIFAVLAVPVVLLLLSFALAVGFEDKVADAVLTRVYRMVETEVRHERVSLNLWRKFPNAALEVHGLKVADPFGEGALARIERACFQLNLWDLLRGQYNVGKVDVQQVSLQLRTDARGRHNWDVIRTEEDTSSSEFSLQLSAVQLSDVSVHFADEGSDFKTDFLLQKMTAKGDFTQEKFTVKCSLQLLLQTLQADTSFQWGDVDLQAKGEIAVNLKEDKYQFKQVRLGINREKFQLDGSMQGFHDSLWRYVARVEGSSVSVSRMLEAVPVGLDSLLASCHVDGSLDVTVQASGILGHSDGMLVKAGFSVRKGEFWRTGQHVGLKDAAFSGTLETGSPDFSSSFKLRVRPLTAKLFSGSLQGWLSLDDLNAPHVRMQLKTTSLRLQDLKSFLPVPASLRMEGETDADLQVEHTLPPFPDVRLEHFRNASVSGSLKLSDGLFQADSASLLFEDFSASMAVSDQVLNIARFSGKIQGNKCEMSGIVRNWLDYFCTGTAVLQANLKLSSPYMDVDAFLPSGNEKGASAAAEPATGVRLPDRLQAEVQVAAKRLKCDRFEASQIKGMLKLHPRKLFIQGFSMEALGGRAELNGEAAALAGGGFQLKAMAKTDKVDIQRLFYAMHDFGMEHDVNGLTHQHIRGVAKTDILFSAVLDSTLELLPQTIHCDAEVSVNNGRLLNYKPLESLSNFVSMEDLKEIRFETLKNRVGVHQSVVSIPEMEIKNSALNLFLSGNQTFKGDLHYNLKLHVSELLAKKRRARSQEFGEVEDDGSKGLYLYLLVAGTTDNPVFKWNREKARADFKDNLQQQKQELKSLFGGDKKDNGAGTPVSPAKEEKKKLNDSKQKPAELEVGDDW